MNKNQAAAYVMGQAAELFARVSGMTAENQQRAHRGESMAYVESDFLAALDASGCHHNAALSTFQDAED